jgi:hypothetical protein
LNDGRAEQIPPSTLLDSCNVKSRAIALWILAIALPLAVELTIKPSKALSIALFSIVGVTCLALLASLVWNWPWPWNKLPKNFCRT